MEKVSEEAYRTRFLVPLLKATTSFLAYSRDEMGGFSSRIIESLEHFLLIGSKYFSPPSNGNLIPDFPINY